MTADAELLAELTALETRVWEALVNGDKAADADALDDRFLGVYPDGFAAKVDHISQLDDGPTIAAFTLSQRRVMSLGQDHAILCYRTDFTRTGRNKAEAMYVSSVWERRGSSWTNIFSQDTPAAD